jgi:hypothetical protein
MLLNRVPWGNYKISRDAILAAKLPVTFTTRSNWHGALPRDLLITFCHNNRLSDPTFSLSEMAKLQNTNQTQPGQSGYLNATGRGPYRCAVKILSKAGELRIECCSEVSYRNKNDAFQSAALKAINLLNEENERICLQQEHATFSMLVCQPVTPGMNVSVSVRCLN